MRLWIGPAHQLNLAAKLPLFQARSDNPLHWQILTAVAKYCGCLYNSTSDSISMQNSRLQKSCNKQAEQWKTTIDLLCLNREVGLAEAGKIIRFIRGKSIVVFHCSAGFVARLLQSAVSVILFFLWELAYRLPEIAWA